MADSPSRKAARNGKHDAPREAVERQAPEDGRDDPWERSQRLEWEWEAVYVPMPQSGKPFDYERWGQNLWNFCEVLRREGEEKAFVSPPAMNHFERVALSLIQAGLFKGKGALEKLLSELSAQDDHNWMRAFHKPGLLHRVRVAAYPPPPEAQPPTTPSTWTTRDVEIFWLTFENKAREEWPWRVYVIDPERLAKLLNTDISAVRVRVILKAMSAAAFEASKVESRDFVRFMSPPIADPPGGIWRDGEQEFVSKISALEISQYQDFCQPHKLWFSQNVGHSGWGPPLLPENPWERMVSLLLLMTIHCPTAWEVPLDQWGRTREDFELCRSFEPVRTLHPLLNRRGQIGFPAERMSQTVSGLALHNSNRARDTPRKSLEAWRAKWALDEFRFAYDIYRIRIERRWKWKEPNPFLRFISFPTKQNAEEARIASGLAFRGQVRDRDVQGPAIPADLSPERVRDGIDRILACVSIAAGVTVQRDAQKFARAFATLYEDADGVLAASLREVDEFVRGTTETNPFVWTEAMLDELEQVRRFAPSLQSSDENTKASTTAKLRRVFEALADRERLLTDLVSIKTEPPTVRTEPPKGNQDDPPRASNKRKRGRPVKYDPKKDRRFFDAWATGHYRDFEHLGRTFGVSKKAAENAIERERKRRNK